MKKTYLKLIIDEIKSSFGRFAAIFSIVALSIGFLAGLLASTPDMRITADNYYDERNTADIFIKATMGLTEKDITALYNIDGIKEIMPAYVLDMLLNTEKEVLTGKIFGLPLLSNNNSPINNLKLVSGRMIENKNECVVENGGGSLSDIEIGTKLVISKENEDYENIDDKFNTLEYTVVGVVDNPFYYSVEGERSSIGSGKTNVLVYIDESSYALDVYTDFYITLKGANSFTAFSDEYELYVESFVNKLKSISKKQSLARLQEVKDKANDKLNEAKTEYADAKAEVEEELADAQKKINDGKTELADALVKLTDGRKELEDAKATLKIETDDALKKISDGINELEDAKVELDDGEIKYADGLLELEDGQKKYDDGYKEFLDGEQELKDAQKKFDDGERLYLFGVDELKVGRYELYKGYQELNAAKAKLTSSEQELIAGQNALTIQKAQFDGLVSQVVTATSIATSSSSIKNNDELLQAIRNDTTTSGGISTTVTGILVDMKANLVAQEALLQTAKSALSAQITDLESKIENPPDDVDENTIETYKNDINTLKNEVVTISTSLAALQASINTFPDSSQKLLFTQDSITAGEAQLNGAAFQIASGWEQYNVGIKKLENAALDIEVGETKLNKAKRELEDNRKKLEDGWKELEEARVELVDAKKKLDDGQVELEDARKELDDGWKKYNDGVEEIKDAQETLKMEIEKANIEIADAEIDLAEGYRDYEKGKNELLENEQKYLDGKRDAQKELGDALVKITDAEQEISEIKTPEWYVLDRNSNVSYASFSMNSSKVADVTKVFPIFFFLIAALVTLTTMTRMVEEERSQIGTLKALGYKKSIIIFKYIIYSGLASTLGSITGLIIGFRLFPRVIWNAYRTMYSLPDLTNQFLWEYALPISLLIIVLTVSVTVYVSYSSLKEKPSTLMLPRAPKAGKKIFLERIDFIWSRMKFSYKSTARNIMRYKKHLFMTIIGVSGCTALVLSGFGIKDSIGSIANTQFIDIFKYDLRVELEDVDEYDSVLKNILNNFDKVEDYAEIFSDTGYVYNKNDKLTVSIKIPINIDTVGNIITLRDLKSGNKIGFSESSIILTQKLAEIIGVSVGDKFVMEDGDGKTAEFSVTAITENYVGTYIYMNKNDYEKAFNKEIKINSILINVPSKVSNFDDITTEILNSESVMNVEPITQLKKSFDNLLGTMNYIVIVLIVASGALAIIVLYNLTNININERRKELSTLKVLGYHKEEIAGYVFRETFILSLIGTFLGLPFGVMLHTFVIKTVEAANLMLGRSISTQSYIYSIIITLFFSIVVDLILLLKLNKIEMVESMKAID